MSSIRKSVLGIGLALALAGSAQAIGNAAPRMQLESSVAPLVDKSHAGNGKVAFTLANHGSTTLHVLRYQVPFDGIEENLFDVRLNGQPVRYLGPAVKRAEASAEDYLQLAPGESRTVTVDLGLSYDMSQVGMYEVRFQNRLSELFVERGEHLASLPKTDVASRVGYVWVDGFTAAVNREAGLRESIGQALGQQADAVSYNRCTASQQSSLVSAVTAAQNYAANSNSYLGANNQGTRYTKWFGTVTTSRYNAVKSHFTNIASALGNSTKSFDCGCKKKTTYAYVYPNQPYQYYLCGAFWSAPMTGTDSKGGTLIHETSHFDIVAGTDDYVYGQSGAANLAITDPAKAIMNADNHEYFSENNPAGN